MQTRTLVIALWSIAAVIGGSILYGAWDGESMNLGAVVSETGELAWRLLAITILLGLFTKLFPRNKILRSLLPLRKHTGILTFVFAAMHGVAQITRMGPWESVTDITKYSFSVDVTIWGTLALLLMVPLFLTSNDWSKRVLQKMWKPLQSLTHIVFVLVAIHVILVQYVWYGEFPLETSIYLMLYVGGYIVLGIKTGRWLNRVPMALAIVGIPLGLYLNVQAINSGAQQDTPSTDTGETSATSSSLSSPTSSSTINTSTNTSSTGNTETLSSGTVKYTVPQGHTDSISVTVIVDDGIITDVTSEHYASNRESENYQRRFQQNYQEMVIGEPLDGLQLRTVSGASLTTKAFNKAIASL